MYGFIKSFDEVRRVGVISTVSEGDVCFILAPGDLTPTVDSCVHFELTNAATNIVFEKTNDIQKFRGEAALGVWAAETRNVREQIEWVEQAPE